LYPNCAGLVPFCTAHPSDPKFLFLARVQLEALKQRKSAHAAKLGMIAEQSPSLPYAGIVGAYDAYGREAEKMVEPSA
jgi:hypothetical protein